MIYFEIAILSFVALLAIIVWAISLRNFIRDMKTAREWKKRRELAKLFCDYYELITGEKHTITVSLNTNNYEFEYNKEA